MKKREAFKAVFFDLDGTLLNTLPDIAAAVNYSLEKHGFSPLPLENYRELVGWGLSETIRKALPPDMDDPELKELVRLEMLEEYRRNPVVGTVPYPGVVEMLEELEARQLSMAILSNKEDSITREVVRQVLGAYPFLGVLGSSEQIPPKPDLTGARLLLERAGIPADQVLFVGDTELDITTARNIGAFPVAVSWGYRSIGDLRKAKPGLIVDSSREILDLLDGKVLDRSGIPSL